ncbi:MAG: S-layer homology domain-containing protein [Defluviitaleaceae bacterium]|nr:S-layer homology domain-containing protein [Defluviitaleaceae bacterium]
MKKRKAIKRLLDMMLVLVMIFGALPVSAFADGEGDDKYLYYQYYQYYEHYEYCGEAQYQADYDIPRPSTAIYGLATVEQIADLVNLIEQAQARLEAHYTPETWAILVAALNNAVTQLDYNRTIADITAATSDLAAALGGLAEVVADWQGAGTSDNPFLIANAEDLMLLATRVNESPRPPNNSQAGAGAFAGVHFMVTADIQLDSDWQPIGTPFIATAWVNPNQHQGTSFEGIFDGGGHTIRFAHGSQPLFGAVWHNAEIRNLNIYGPYIAGHGLIAGVAAQSSFGTPQYVLIDNVWILSGTTIRGSGFAGTDGFRPQQLNIRNSTVEAGVRIGFDADANAPHDQNIGYFAHNAGSGPGVGSFVSGLAGTIYNSVSYATVYGHPNVRNVGGLAGYKQQSMRSFLIDSSHFHGTVSAPYSMHVGGILGASYDSPNPRNSAWHGQLTGATAANNAPSENIRNSIVTGTIIGYDFVGGIVGGTFTNQSWSDGGGGAHHFHVPNPNMPEHNVINNHFDGTVTAMRQGTRNVGAIFGYIRSLNRNNNIAGNTFAAGSAYRGIGHISIIDTIHPNPTTIGDTTYFSTQGGSPGNVAGFGLGGFGAGAGRADYYRTDDPMGTDKSSLVAAIGEEPVDWQGAGTAENPFRIYTAADLALLASRTNDPATNRETNAHFRIMADISLPADWTPIGIHGTNNNIVFGGIIDGGGHTITFAHGSRALLGAVRFPAEIRNINIFGTYIADNGLISGVGATMPMNANRIIIDNVNILSGTTIRRSGFVGEGYNRVVQVSISNSTIQQNVRIGWSMETNAPTDHAAFYNTAGFGSGPGVGSFASGLIGEITNSVSYATVYGQNQVGGLVGWKGQTMRPFQIDNSHFRGTVIATGDFVGGIVGSGHAHRNTNGLPSGSNTPGVNISNSTVTGTINGRNNVGGIFGGEQLQKQAWDNGIGRIVGNHFGGTINATGENVGAIIGYMHSINRNNVIAGNTFAYGSAPRAFGRFMIVDTIHQNPTPVTGTTYFSSNVTAAELANVRAWLYGQTGINWLAGAGFMANGITQTGHARTDDPLGADLARLATVIGTSAVDRAVLEAAIIAAEALNSANYTPATWQAVETALVAAITVRDNAEATQIQINGALAALELAIAGLAARANFAALNQAITAAEARTEANYTTASWNAMQTALAAARYVVNNVNATQQQADDAATALNTAIVQLTPAGGGLPGPDPGPEPSPNPARVRLTVYNPNPRAGYNDPVLFLQNGTVRSMYIYINEGETAYSIIRRDDVGLYVQSTGHSVWAGMYVEAVNGWGEFDGGPLSGWMYAVDRVLPQFSASLFELENGQVLYWLYTYDLGDDLVPRFANSNFMGVSRADLQALIAQAEQRVEANYTAASWSTFQTAIESARRVYATGISSQSDINIAISNLRNAMEALITHSSPGAPGTGGNQGGQGNQGGVQAEPSVVQQAAMAPGTTVAELELTIAHIKELIAEHLALTAASEIAVITLDVDTLAGIAYGRDADWVVTITAEIADPDVLTTYQREIAGNNTIISLLVMVNGVEITRFDGIVSIIMPYMSNMAADDRDLMTVYRIEGDGISEIPGAAYDGEYMAFTTDQFSLFFISPWISPFGDVGMGDWYFRDVRFVYSEGFMRGVGGGDFAPNTELSRAMAVTILWNMAGNPIVQNGANFHDVAASNWYADAIAWASANGIVQGHGNGTFAPNESVTREQLAVIFQNFAGFNGQDVTNSSFTTEFADEASISAWALDAMAWANAQGLITGRTLTTLVPTGTATRAEAASIMNRFAQ